MLQDYIKNYLNTEEINNHFYSDFTEKTDNISYLKAHRDYIEINNLGFGERAFPYMWLLLLTYVKNQQLNNNLLEIGVFKGQIISLWSIIESELNSKFNITGITPLQGNPQPKNPLWKSLLSKISDTYKKNSLSGNFYENEDYLSIIKKVFSEFQLNFEKIKLLKGFSTDENILKRATSSEYSIIYIDGDHTYEGVTKDIINYAPLIVKNGFLVMDDASCNIPGTLYWKGHQSVSDACKIIESYGFTNILNVGHNRIYQKT